MASCVNNALTHEIKWPDVQKREELGEQSPSFEGYIRFVNGTLVKIRRSHGNHDHSNGTFFDTFMFF